MQNFLRTGLSRLKDIQERIEEKFDGAIRDVNGDANFLWTDRSSSPPPPPPPPPLDGETEKAVVFPDESDSELWKTVAPDPLSSPDASAEDHSAPPAVPYVSSSPKTERLNADSDALVAVTPSESILPPDVQSDTSETLYEKFKVSSLPQIPEIPLVPTETIETIKEAIPSTPQVDELEILRRGLHDMREENAGFRAALEHITQVNILKDMAVVDLQKQLEQERGLAKEFQQEHSQAMRQNSDLAQTVNHLRSEVGSLVNQIQELERLSQASREIEALRKHTQALESAYAESEEQRQAAVRAMAAAEAQSLAKVEKAREESIAAVAAANRRATLLERGRKGLEDQIQALREEVAMAKKPTGIELLLKAKEIEIAKESEVSEELRVALRQVKIDAEKDAKEKATQIAGLLSQLNAAKRRVAHLLEETETWKSTAETLQQKDRQLMQQQLLQRQEHDCKACALQNVLNPPMQRRPEFEQAESHQPFLSSSGRQSDLLLRADLEELARQKTVAEDECTKLAQEVQRLRHQIFLQQRPPPPPNPV